MKITRELEDVEFSGPVIHPDFRADKIKSVGVTCHGVVEALFISAAVILVCLQIFRGEK